jgi:hypothetical protein
MLNDVKLPALVAGATPAAIVPTTLEDAFRVAKFIHASGLAPYKSTPESILIVLMKGLEVGLKPMAAMEGIAVINNRATIWGATLLGIVRASGMLEDLQETFEGKDVLADDFKAVCKVKRRGETHHTTAEFSVADAKLAGLKRMRSGSWEEARNDSPWHKYPKRMLQMRARIALRDAFSDILGGMIMREEADTIETVDYQVVSGTPAIDPSEVSEVSRDADNARTDTSETRSPPEVATPAPASGEAPSPDNPVEYADYVKAGFDRCSSIEAVQIVWDQMCAPVEKDMFPPDFENLIGLYERAQERFAP